MKLLIVLSIVLSVFNAYAGGRDSGGIDVLDYKQLKAWFTDQNKSIKYCVQVSADFGLSESEVKEEFNKSIADWQSSLTIRNRDEDEQTIGETVNQNYTESSCDQADLTLFFGVENELVTKQKIKYHNPKAFVFKSETKDYKVQGECVKATSTQGAGQSESYCTASWSKGFLWVNAEEFKKTHISDQQKKLGLRIVLKHEVGHIYGFRHIRGTIMQSDIFFGFPKYSNALSQNNQTYSSDSEKIERTRAFPQERNEPFYGTIGFQRPTPMKAGQPELPDYQPKIQEKKAFKKLFNREPVGKVIASVEMIMQKQKLTLKIKDDSSQKSFPIVVKKHPRSFDVSSRCDENGVYAWQSATSGIEDFSCTFYGSVITLSGKKLTVIGEYNIDNDYFSKTGPIVLKVIEDGAVEVLFQSFYVGQQAP